MPKLEAFLGYTVEELRRHLERQFTKGMTWARFHAREIEVDHRVPLVRFDLRTDEGMRAAWALTNLQPLWKPDNAAKGSVLLVLL